MSTTQQPASNKNGGSEKPNMKKSQLLKLFVDELKDIYWAENALTKALPKMAENAREPELIEAIETHLQETKGQIEKLEQVFKILGQAPEGKKCEAMAGLIKEGEEIMADTEEGPQRDAGIISAAQKVEHYEIASYGTLRAFSQTLGLTDAALLLEAILQEEKNCNNTLTDLAESTINASALEEDQA